RISPLRSSVPGDPDARLQVCPTYAEFPASGLYGTDALGKRDLPCLNAARVCRFDKYHARSGDTEIPRIHEPAWWRARSTQRRGNEPSARSARSADPHLQILGGPYLQADRY